MATVNNMSTVEDTFDMLTKKERRELGLDRVDEDPGATLEHQADQYTRGMDKKKLDRELQRLE